jgi:tetratricopeptide (TPR) repeat protein
VQAILAARIDRLPPDAKRLLQIASVVGKDVPYALLEAIAGLPDPSLRQTIGQLQAAEFLNETRLFPDMEYTFKHALTHEVAYGSLLHDRRRALHVQIVEAIERLYPGRLVEHVERLAHHALRGEVWEKALTYTRQAGAKAEARAANREAVEYFERALVALKHLPDSRHWLEQAIELRFDLRRPLFQLGETDKMLAYLREARALAEALGDQLRQGWSLAQLGGHAWISGNQPEALELSQRAYEIATTTNDLALRVHTGLRVAWAYHALGDYGRAVDFLTESIAPLEGDRVTERFGHVGFPAIWSRSQLAWCLAERGEFDKGLVHGEEAVRLAIAVGHQFSRVVSGLGLGVHHLIRGEFEAAIAVLEPCHQLSETVSIATGSLYITPFLGLAYARAGRPERALPLLQATIEFSGARKLLLYQAGRVVALGEVCLSAGRVPEALEQAARALDLARRHHERGHEAYALRLRAEIAARHQPAEVENAEAYYREAMALADELGMRPLVAHCHLGLGKVSRRIGKLQEAQGHLATTITMYREMGMRYWLEQAEAKMGRV